MSLNSSLDIRRPGGQIAERQGHVASSPSTNPLLLIGHGTRNSAGRQMFLDFAAAYQKLDINRPVIPCFLELTEPTIQQGIEQCLELGYQEITAVSLLLFAARHNKFDVTQALDRARSQYPNLKFHYGKHLGITTGILELWQQRLALADESSSVPREESVLLVVGRGSSDPDANSEVYKLARLLWEGSNFKGVEVCFIGITHPRMDQGFARIQTWASQRVVVLPHFLFTGVLMEKIRTSIQSYQQQDPQIQLQMLNEIGMDPILFELVRQREEEARAGQVMMNCELCKFRRTFTEHHHHGSPDNSHHHHHSHHTHDLAAADPYSDLSQYHQRIWQAP